ncbi:uncharacterized protein LOC106666343 [Cimex lectularius]|uniref:Uncharacterized protein n=1 Tax=Cimex lectularius TaxID=79782 RepID=A0A8I6SHE4_CIMLE|nr:uncharacterized protein LOC106666343 [Cimex lectularius]
MNYKGFVTNCPLFQLKSFFFCMKLRTGCYFISLLYLAWGGILFREELSSAEFMFSYRLENKYVSVFFTYDVMPTLMVIFSIFFIYGLYKEHLLFVFSGVSLISLLFSLFVMIMVDASIRHYISDTEYLSLLLTLLGLAFLSLIVVKSYYNELSLKKNRTSRTLEERQTANTEFENPQSLS